MLKRIAFVVVAAAIAQGCTVSDGSALKEDAVPDLQTMCIFASQEPIAARDAAYARQRAAWDADDTAALRARLESEGPKPCGEELLAARSESDARHMDLALAFEAAIGSPAGDAQRTAMRRYEEANTRWSKAMRACRLSDQDHLTTIMGANRVLPEDLEGARLLFYCEAGTGGGGVD